MEQYPAFDGLYALASLDGAPLDPRDLAVLGLLPGDPGDGFSVTVRDGGHEIAQPEGTAAFAGHLDDGAGLSASLGLDPKTSPLALALAALERHGADAASAMPGEWELARWDAPARMLTLLAADTARDPLLYATDGRRVAVAPHIRVLRRLGWVGRALSPRGLLLHAGRTDLRDTIVDETILRGVRQAVPGTRVVVDARGVRTAAPRPPAMSARWRGNFADAVAELDATLRLVLNRQLARHPSAAVMLSGGLDSSLIAAFGAAERGTGRLFAVTSAAPPGSGLADETGFSRMVADYLGLAMLPVSPDADAAMYRPSRRMLRALDGPLVSPYHYLHEALIDTARRHGADAVFDGVYGEWTITGYLDASDWRSRVRSLRNRLRRSHAPHDAQQAFHIRLAAPAVAFADTELRAERAARAPSDGIRRDDACRGFPAGMTKNRLETTATPWPGVRRLIPFRDRRLLALFAGMPAVFLEHAGQTRAPARALLAGRIPDVVRLRSGGMPFSPDYALRLRRQALAARADLPAYERAGVGEWIDLGWLDTALAGVAMRDGNPLNMLFEVQTTATAAAFLSDWLTGPD